MVCMEGMERVKKRIRENKKAGKDTNAIFPGTFSFKNTSRSTCLTVNIFGTIFGIHDFLAAVKSIVA